MRHKKLHANHSNKISSGTAFSCYMKVWMQPDGEYQWTKWYTVLSLNQTFYLQMFFIRKVKNTYNHIKNKTCTVLLQCTYWDKAKSLKCCIRARHITSPDIINKKNFRYIILSCKISHIYVCTVRYLYRSSINDYKLKKKKGRGILMCYILETKTCPSKPIFCWICA